MRRGASKKIEGLEPALCTQYIPAAHWGLTLIWPFPDSCRYQLGVRKLKTSHPRTLDPNISADIRPHPHLGT
jgi:hypothetical protein